MSNRQLASAKQRRGDAATIVTDEGIRRIFNHFTKAKTEPANSKTNPWQFVKPFKGVIRGDKHNSELPHGVEVEIRNGSQYADLLNIAKNTLLTLIYRDFPNGTPSGSKTLADAKVAEYQKTLCHQYLKKHYENAVTGDWGSGKPVDAMGQNLYMMFEQRDPALFTFEQFQQAKNDPRFFDAQGKIKFAPLSQIRCIMQFAALQIDDSPLSQKRFHFLKGDEWDTRGKKNIGGKKDDYLQEHELTAYVNSINEIDTLVLHRLSLEGGGRISSQLLMGSTLPNGYRCQALWDMNSISMMEPKVEGSKSGGKVKRYFVPETTQFFKKYVDDFHIVGSWFSRYPSEQHNYLSYSSSIKYAGLRAGIWRWRFGKAGALAEGEKLASNGQVYKLKAFNDNKKGTVRYQKDWQYEGKMTTTHTVGKHTFVSLAGLHGLSLDDCSEQCGTDPTTIRDFYHGTLGDKLRAVILGEKTCELWKDWIHRFVNPLYTKRYNELMRQQNGGVNMQVIAKVEAVMAEVEG